MDEWIDEWTAAAGIHAGALFRRVRKGKYGENAAAALSERMVWHVVMK